MQCTLNFSGGGKEKLGAFLSGFPKERTNTAFEEFRCRIGKSVVTLYSSGKVLVQGNDCERVKELILEAAGSGGGLVLGIDETGRGESFGPFVVAGVLGRPADLRELRDSKKVRDWKSLWKIVQRNAMAIAVFSVSAGELSWLHRKGISMNAIEAHAINALHDFFRKIEPGLETVVDGKELKGCRKGISFVVRGDDLNPVVGAASIAAKAAREMSGNKDKREGWGSWQRR